MVRGDLSNSLVHLTRSTSIQNAADSFQSIFNSGILRGSNLGIRGGHSCVCFSETPLSTLTQALAVPLDEKGMRYEPFGVIVGKSWLFERGGRPVIYQPEEEYELLNEAQQYRHVRYEPNRGKSKDFTWEREWRIKIEELQLDFDHVTFVVPTRKWEKRFQDKHTTKVAMTSYVADIPVVQTMPWHFVVLEDLGFSGFDEYNL